MKEQVLWRPVITGSYILLLAAAMVFMMAPSGMFESSVIPGAVLILISAGIWIFLLWRWERVLDRKRMAATSPNSGVKT